MWRRQHCSPSFSCCALGHLRLNQIILLKLWPSKGTSFPCCSSSSAASSVPSRTRKPGESAIYRNVKTPHDGPLVKTATAFPTVQTLYGELYCEKLEVIFCRVQMRFNMAFKQAKAPRSLVLALASMMVPMSGKRTRKWLIVLRTLVVVCWNVVCSQRRNNASACTPKFVLQGSRTKIIFLVE